MSVITFDTAYARVKAVADERPDHTTGSDDFANCHYFEEDGSPSCLVGMAFADVLYAGGVDQDSHLNDEGVGSLVENGVLPLTQKAYYFLSSAQSTQDNGGVWRDATDSAFRYVEENDFDDSAPFDTDYDSAPFDTDY